MREKMGPSDCAARLTPSEGEREGWVDVSLTVVGTPPESCPREGPWVSLPCLREQTVGIGLMALQRLPSDTCSTSWSYSGQFSFVGITVGNFLFTAFTGSLCVKLAWLGCVH